MSELEYTEYTEFFEVGDKVARLGEHGLVVETYELDKRNVIVGGALIVKWDSKDEFDFENCSGAMEKLLSRLDSNHKFKYIEET